MFPTIPKTKEELAKEQLNDFSRESSVVLGNYKDNYKRLFDMIWNSEVPPQDFFDIMGSNAVSVFVTAQKVVTHIMELDPTYTAPAAPYEYTINPDGTVTVGEKTVDNEG